MEGLEIENNSFLDYNTNNNGHTNKDTDKNKSPEKIPFHRLTETSENGDTLLTLTFKISRGHPIFKRKNLSDSLNDKFRCNINLDSTEVNSSSLTFQNSITIKGENKAVQKGFAYLIEAIVEDESKLVTAINGL